MNNATIKTTASLRCEHSRVDVSMRTDAVNCRCRDECESETSVDQRTAELDEHRQNDSTHVC